MATVPMLLTDTEILNLRPLMLNRSQIIAIKTKLGTTNKLAFYVTKHEISNIGTGIPEKGIMTIRIAIINSANYIVNLDGKDVSDIDTSQLKNTSLIFKSTLSGVNPLSAVLIENGEAIILLDRIIINLKINPLNSRSLPDVNKFVQFFVMKNSITPTKYDFVNYVFKISGTGGGPGGSDVKPAP